MPWEVLLSWTGRSSLAAAFAGQQPGQIAAAEQDRTLICSISDHGRGASGLPAGPPPNDRPGGRGLYLARQLTGALLIDQHGDGVTATVTVELATAA